MEDVYQFVYLAITKAANELSVAQGQVAFALHVIPFKKNTFQHSIWPLCLINF